MRYKGFVPVFGLMLIIFILCLVQGCAMSHGPKAAGEGIVKSRPVVFVHPLEPRLYRGARLAVFPFVGDSGNLAMPAAAAFRDAFLASGLFKAVYVVDKPVYTRTEAVATAAARGADLAAFARINRAFVDGGVGGSGLGVSLRLIHVKSGDTVWYIRQGVERPVNWPRKDLVARLSRALSPSPVLAPAPGNVLPNMLQIVAFDMARVMADG